MGWQVKYKFCSIRINVTKCSIKRRFFSPILCSIIGLRVCHTILKQNCSVCMSFVRMSHRDGYRQLGTKVQRRATASRVEPKFSMIFLVSYRLTAGANAQKSKQWCESKSTDKSFLVFMIFRFTKESFFENMSGGKTSTKWETSDDTTRSYSGFICVGLFSLYK